MLADEFLPSYDVSDSVALVAESPPERTWEALLAADLLEAGRGRPLIGALGAIRMLPEIAGHLLHGERPPSAPERLRLRDTTELPMGEGGWVLLAEREKEAIALGLVGKFWRPVIEFAEVTVEGFREFDEPGYAKTVYQLGVRRLGEGRTQIEGLMRTATTDEHARRWFRRYWTLGVGSGAHLLVSGFLEHVRDLAENASRPA